jgi:hypothetical protein
MTVSYTLDNAAETHREFPATFEIPPQRERESLRVGDLVKLIFRIEFADEAHVERMWVLVSEVRPESYVGVLDNELRMYLQEYDQRWESPKLESIFDDALRNPNI